MVSHRRIVRVLAAAALSAVLAAQQAGSVRGVVRDKDFGAVVGGASVTLVETGQKTTTSEQGTFVLPDVVAGRYTVIVAKDGYVRQVRADVVVTAGKLTELAFELSGDFTEMEEYIVEDALQLGGGTEAELLQVRFESPALLDSISAELMNRAGASDAAGALRLVAGASVQDGKTAVIRGLPDRYVSSQLNGVRLPSADEDKRAVELDQFPAAVIESIQVAKTFTPDQQGDASGGAVDVRLKGVPDEPLLLKFSVQQSHNTNVTGRGDFLSYDGGGVHFTGEDDGRRNVQWDALGDDWDGAVGTSREEAPLDHKWSLAVGGRRDLGRGWRIGGLASVFYERDSAFFDRGVDESWWVESPGRPMTPRTSQGTVQDGDFKTSLFDVTQGEQSVQWGGLGTFGIENDDHSLTFVWLHTRTAEDVATLAEDTRGKQYFFPGYDPANPNTPGHQTPAAAPYLRLETLEYTERTTDTLQLSGRHRLRTGTSRRAAVPELDWTISRSEADLYQPDKRQFGSQWIPERQFGSITVPATHGPYKPAANFTLGNVQRIWKEIDEQSEQYAANVKIPFAPLADGKGQVKFGWFQDRVERAFDQETFSNFGDNSTYFGEFGQHWSQAFPFENHPITESTFDVDYRGEIDVQAWYAMIELPIVERLDLITGVRFESTKIAVANEPEADATWFPPGSLSPTLLRPGDADVAFDDDDVLPAVALVWRVTDTVTLRGSYAETIARQTFKELTPILQQEFLGGPVFIGNPELRTSQLDNQDLRADWEPYDGGLISVSWFKKDLEGPIEYVQRIATFDFTTAVNYPDGRLEGFELETRHALGEWWEPLQGLAIGANATFIDSKVTLPEDEAAEFRRPEIAAPITTRDMTNAPEHLYNAWLTWDVESTSTQFGLFYTVQGDTLVAGAGTSNSNFVPSVRHRVRHAELQRGAGTGQRPAPAVPGQESDRPRDPRGLSLPIHRR
ncbi:MAG: TonB-dependent receptor [Planctomycetes bacterium]|nr:TonB-dependent receptor [Planctomycetota bacterium]